MLTREAKTRLHGVKPLPSWQAEKQVREVQPLPSRQAETWLLNVQPLPPREAQTNLQGVQNNTRGAIEFEADQARAGEFAPDQNRVRDQARARCQAIHHPRLFRDQRRGREVRGK